MNATTLREQVHRIADALPPEATWDDVRYQIELHASIARGLADVAAGRVIAVEELMKEIGVTE
jgi:predicted transcriptional regulator